MCTIDERKQILKKAFWDKKIDLDTLISFINGEIDRHSMKNKNLLQNNILFLKWIL